MEHTEVRQKLSAYLDGAVSGAEREELEAHLAGCSRCRAALADLERTVGHLRNLSKVEPPSWLTAKIMAKVREEARPSPSLWQRLFFPLHVKLPLEAVALVFLCVTGYYLARTSAPELVAPPAPQVTTGVPPSEQPQPQAGTGQKEQSPQTARQPVAPAPKGTAGPKPESTAPAAPAMVPPAPPEMRPEPVLPAVAPASPAMAKPRQAPAAAVPAAPEGAAARPSGREAAGRGEDALAPFGEAETGPRPQPARKAKKAARPVMSEASRGIDGAVGGQVRQLTLRVYDAVLAEGKVEEALRACAGTVVRREKNGAATRITVRIGTQRIGDFLPRLEKIGRIEQKPELPEGTAGVLELSVVIEPLPEK